MENIILNKLGIKKEEISLEELEKQALQLIFKSPEETTDYPSIAEQVEANSQAIESIMNILAGGELNV